MIRINFHDGTGYKDFENYLFSNNERTIVHNYANDKVIIDSKEYRVSTINFFNTFADLNANNNNKDELNEIKEKLQTLNDTSFALKNKTTENIQILRSIEGLNSDLNANNKDELNEIKEKLQTLNDTSFALKNKTTENVEILRSIESLNSDLLSKIEEELKILNTRYNKKIIS